MGYRDPTNPNQEEDSYILNREYYEKYNIQIQEIIASKNSRLSVINGHQFGIGDEVNGLKIIDIKHNGITIEQEGVRVFLPMITTIKSYKKK